MIPARGVIAYDGPSQLGPHRIVVLITASSLNSKTGNMRQTYILLRDTSPTMALRMGHDETICGDCQHRGDGAGADRTCYVSLVTGGPAAVWRAYQAGLYGMTAHAPRDVADLLTGETIRLGAYGDPAAVPYKYWSRWLTGARGWTGYTHQWRTCDRRFRQILMASVDTPEELREAQQQGWRTYRARPVGDDLLPGEFQCPAADEAGHRTTCARCLLCRGLASPAKSVSIELHGQRFKGTRGAEWLERRDSLGLLRSQLDAGPVTWQGTPQDVSRIRFAISLWYHRQGSRARLAVTKLREHVYDLRLR